VPSLVDAIGDLLLSHLVHFPAHDGRRSRCVAATEIGDQSVPGSNLLLAVLLLKATRTVQIRDETSTTDRRMSQDLEVVSLALSVDLVQLVNRGLLDGVEVSCKESGEQR
jgi:hypothetical protein